MTRQELVGAHFIRITRGYKDTDPHDKFIVEQTETSISVIDIHDGQTKETYEITEKNGRIKLSNTWSVTVTDDAQCRAYIDRLLPIYQKATTDAESTAALARAREEGYTNFRGRIAQTLNWPQTPAPA